MKKAFTMLELVMVIVILGIVASIGSEIIVSMYTNYLRSRTINTLESKTEIVLEQIAKRLQYRIKDSLITRKTTDIKALSDSTMDETYTILEWIGYSNESFLGTPKPGWSGFIDLDNSDTNGTNRTLKTSESNLTDAANTINALTYGTLTMADASSAAALIFKGRAYSANDFGWGISANSDGNATVKVSQRDATTFNIEEAYPSATDEIYEQYYLAHTAYAISPTGTTTQNGFTDFNLTLYYNYQPWLGHFYTSGSSSLLTNNVSLFRFRQDESIIRLKLCLHDNNQTGVGDYIVVCKEKVIY